MCIFMEPNNTQLFIDLAARRIWLWGFLVFLVYELWTLRPGGEDTLSATIRDTIRFTPWRLLFLPFWTWLTWHWILLPPDQSITPDWRDGIAVALGMMWAVGEIYLRYGSK